jgi:hypothetical protein
VLLSFYLRKWPIINKSSKGFYHPNLRNICVLSKYYITNTQTSNQWEINCKLSTIFFTWKKNSFPSNLYLIQQNALYLSSAFTRFWIGLNKNPIKFIISLNEDYWIAPTFYSKNSINSFVSPNGDYWTALTFCNKNPINSLFHWMGTIELHPHFVIKIQ